MEYRWCIIQLGGGMQSSIKVYIRVRPLLPLQKNSKSVVSVKEGNSIGVLTEQLSEIITTFDLVFESNKTQKEFYFHFQPFLTELYQGANITVFAYGQTGSGKTYTMFGCDWEHGSEASHGDVRKQTTVITDLTNDQNTSGIIPRAIHQIFTEKKAQTNVFCSFLQIYNEKIFDLLNEQIRPLAIHESKDEGIFVEGLIQFKVNKIEDCLELMRRGEANRHTRQTSMNTKSSRSHTLFQITLEDTTKSRLNLCDLAGSQKINKKEQMSEEHLQELKSINLSLTTLGKVIASLGDKRKSLAAFRESKLTRLLQDSLTNNKYTFIVGNISPSSNNTEQTLNTFKFVQRARHITMKTKAVSNADIVSRMQQELEQLRWKLQQNQQQNPQQKVPQEEYSKLKNENIKIKQQLIQLQNKLFETGSARREKTPQLTFYLPSDGESDQRVSRDGQNRTLVQAGEAILFGESPFSSKMRKANLIQKVEAFEDKKKRYENIQIQSIQRQLPAYHKAKKHSISKDSPVNKNKSKPDYREKIRELEARLFGK